MKLLSVLFLWLVFACSCKNDTLTIRSVSGKYTNTFEKNAIHFVELYPDKTFLHYYSVNNQIVENRGTWKLHDPEDKFPEISFKYWKSFGKYRDKICVDGCLEFVKLNRGELVFDVDIPDEMNFEKEQ